MTIPERKRMTRSQNERIIGGVAGGLAAYFNIDPLLVRLIFLVLGLMQGLGVFIYLILWLLMPAEGTSNPNTRGQVRENFSEMQQATERFAAQVRGVMQDIFRN